MQGLNGLVDINRHNTILEAALSKLTFQILIINQDMIKHGRMRVMELTGRSVSSVPFFLTSYLLMAIFLSLMWGINDYSLAVL
jgi:hypothetical protein